VQVKSGPALNLTAVLCKFCTAWMLDPWKQAGVFIVTAEVQKVGKLLNFQCKPRLLCPSPLGFRLWAR
jgi:hypothetical protein